MEDSKWFSWFGWLRVVITITALCSRTSSAQKKDSIRLIAYEEEAIFFFPIYLHPTTTLHPKNKAVWVFSLFSGADFTKKSTSLFCHNFAPFSLDVDTKGEFPLL